MERFHFGRLTVAVGRRGVQQLNTVKLIVGKKAAIAFTAAASEGIMQAKGGSVARDSVVLLAAGDTRRRTCPKLSCSEVELSRANAV